MLGKFEVAHYLPSPAPQLFRASACSIPSQRGLGDLDDCGAELHWRWCQGADTRVGFNDFHGRSLANYGAVVGGHISWDRDWLVRVRAGLAGECLGDSPRSDKKIEGRRL